MNRDVRRYSAGLLGGVLAVMVGASGCSASGDGVRTDRLAAQTSRPGMVVGDALGVSMAQSGASMRTASSGQGRGVSVASGVAGSPSE